MHPDQQGLKPCFMHQKAADGLCIFLVVRISVLDAYSKNGKDKGGETTKHIPMACMMMMGKGSGGPVSCLMVCQLFCGPFLGGRSFCGYMHKNPETVY